MRVNRKLAILAACIVYLSLIHNPVVCLASGNDDDIELREQDPAKLQREMDELSRVTRELAALKKAGKIPNIKSDETGWSGDVAKVTPRYIKLAAYMNSDKFKQELAACNNLYRAVMTHLDSNRRIMLLLCAKSTNIDLISVYEFNGNQWVKMAK